MADILTEAFADDPVMQWVFADPTTRVDHLQTWWRFMLGARPEGSLMLLAPDNMTAAYWQAPKFRTEAPETPKSDGQSVEGVDAEPEQDNAFVTLIGQMVGDRLGEVLAYFGQVVEAHPEEPHWYLSAIGTRLEAQGQGGGHKLLQPMLDRCDTEGLPAYLESSNPRNVPFYFRHGFVSVGELLTPDDSALMTFMRRDPR